MERARSSGGPASTSGNSSSSGALDGSNEDAAFRSRAVQAAVRHHQLWQGDLLSNAETFAEFRRWVEDRLPQARAQAPSTVPPAEGGGAPPAGRGTRRGRMALGRPARPS